MTEPNVTTVEQFYEPQVFEDGEQRWTSQYGVQLPNGSIVTVTNGSLCLQGPSNTPDATNFDLYIADGLPIGCSLVQFDPATKRYVELG